MPAAGRRLHDLVSQDAEFGVGLDEGLRKVDDFNFRAGNSKVGEDALGDPLIDQGAQALRVVGQLDHIVVAV